MSNQQPGEPGFGNFAAQLPNAEKVVHPESITGVRDQGSGLSFPRHASAVESQEKRKGEARKASAPAMFSIPYSLFPIPYSLLPYSLLLHTAGRTGFFCCGSNSASAACLSDCRSIHSSSRERLKRHRLPSLNAGTKPSDAYL